MLHSLEKIVMPAEKSSSCGSIT